MMTKKGLLFIVLSLTLSVLIISCDGDAPNEEKTTDKQTEEPQSVADTKDMGKKPWVLNIEEATVDNEHYRLANWTGENIQLVLMSLKPGEEIEKEMHEGHDQFIRVEQGNARIRMGKKEDALDFDETVSHDWAMLIPAKYWHHIENTGDKDLKIYTIYGPAEHDKGTLHKTYKEAKSQHHGHEE